MAGNKNSGRRKKRDEEKVIKLCQAAIVKEYGSEEAFFLHLAKQSKESYNHLRLLMEYWFGRPTERKEITGANGGALDFKPITFIE